MNFSFRFVKGGNLQGLFFSSKAVLSADGLLLGKDMLPLEALRETTTRDDNVVLALDPRVPLGPELQKNLDQGCLVLRVTNVAALSVERNIDRLASAASAERNRLRLQAEGRGHLFRAERCSHCGAVLDLSEIPRSGYVYCRFCESVLHDATLAVATRGETHRPCDECRMFDRVKGYTESYFYFLVVVYGYSSRRRHMCDACAGRLFWKVLLLNLPFLLGIPGALALKVQSMSGRDPALRDLPEANALARAGQMARASELYGRVHSQIPQHPGVLLNEAHGHMHEGDPAAARVKAEKALAVCPNYSPARTFWLALQLATGGSTLSDLPGLAPPPAPAVAPLPQPASLSPAAPVAASLPQPAPVPAAAPAFDPGAPAFAGAVARLPSSVQTPESRVQPIGGSPGAIGGMSWGRMATLAAMLLVLAGLGTWLYKDQVYRAYNADAVLFCGRLNEVEARFRNSLITATRDGDAAAQARVQEAVRQFRASYAATATDRDRFKRKYGRQDYRSTKFLLTACETMDRIAALDPGERLDPRDATAVTFNLKGANLTLHYVNEHMVDLTKPPQSIATDNGAMYYTQQSWGKVNLDRL